MAITGSPSGGPFVISHGACGRSRVIGNSGVQHRHPSTQPVRVRSIRIGTGWGWCAFHAHRQRRKTRAVETPHLRLKTCTTLGWCFGISHLRGRAPSAPRPGAAGRGWWRLCYGRGHPDHSFLLIDVDRTGSAQSCPPLRSGKHKYGFHGVATDPPHLRLRPGLLPPCRVIPIATRRDPND